MTYQEARDFIDSSNQYGSKLGLESITELLNRLGNPQDKLKIIHVAGTNGKGSTTAFIATILAMEGYRVGRYISPAVFDYLERVQISQRTGKYKQDSESTLQLSNRSDVINTEALEDSLQVVTDNLTEQGVVVAIETIKPVCETVVSEGLSHPTAFEIETAMAFLYLYREKVDFAIIEVGLGGRLDATNVIKKPLCNVITSISLDHMQYLGDTLEQIASEKAGIIKKDAKVITCNTDSAIFGVLQRVSKEYGNQLVLADQDKVEAIQYKPEGTTFVYQDQEYEIHLLGEHQIKNAILAIETAKQLSKKGYSISEAGIQRGLTNTTWSGRFEVLAKNPYFIIDGAHNEDAALQLRHSILQYFANKRKIFILGVLADKDYRKILELTADLADVIITITPKNDRALASPLLAKEAKQYTDGEVVDAGSVDRAVKLAYEMAGNEDIILAFGSLSYLGELRSYIKEQSVR